MRLTTYRDKHIRQKHINGDNLLVFNQINVSCCRYYGASLITAVDWEYGPLRLPVQWCLGRWSWKHWLAFIFPVAAVCRLFCHGTRLNTLYVKYTESPVPCSLMILYDVYWYCASHELFHLLCFAVFQEWATCPQPSGWLSPLSSWSHDID